MPNHAAMPKILRMIQRVTQVAVGLAVAHSMVGCASVRPTPRPLPQLTDPAPCPPASARPRPLVVLLPGRGMALSELTEQGFLDAVRRRGFDVDVRLVDAHLGYYNERSVFEAMQEDVVAPARARGVRDVWLAGISLGGYGALLYDARHPGEIAGVIAIAPYLGLDEVTAEVGKAGGVRAWRAPALDRFSPASTPIETDRHLWRWLHSQAALPADDAGRRIPIFLGYGDSDRFVAAQALAAAALPAERVVVRPGGHDWPAWRAAWDTLLDRVPWPRRAACVKAALGGAVVGG
jgi:pimeloyl-ACP methyl ester carboxylesterase